MKHHSFHHPLIMMAETVYKMLGSNLTFTQLIMQEDFIVL